MTSFETALHILSEHLDTVDKAKAFKAWEEKRSWVEMEAVNVEFEPRPDFEAMRQLFEATEFHALDGQCHFDTNLLRYFRRRSSNIKWLETIPARSHERSER